MFKKLTSAVSSVTGPSGERDPDFEEQRERFERHEKHLQGLKKAVKKHAENFKCLVGPLGVVGDDMNNFYAGTEQGERFKECMQTIEAAVKEFTVFNVSVRMMALTPQSVQNNVEESIEAELKRIGQMRVDWSIFLCLPLLQKEINDRDKIKSEMEKLSKEVAKVHKDATKQRDVRFDLHAVFLCLNMLCLLQNESKYQVAKDLYDKKNPQLTDDLRRLWLDRVTHFEPQFTAVRTSHFPSVVVHSAHSVPST